MAQSFGKYTVVARIGEGGFGTVYEGWDPGLKRRVAIKTCAFRDPDLRRRFIREAEIAASLHHPNIVTVFDFGEEAGEPYLVQELLDGEDLDRLLTREEPVHLEEKVRILRQVAEGLHHAHRRGVVHRDVKPSNVRVLPDGSARLMDFGIAKLLDAGEGLTRTGMSVGTAGYLAPEQLRGEGLDHRADLFSFGVLAYELLAFRKPFEGRNVSTLFFKIAHEEPAPVRDVAPDVPPPLADCVARCLEKDPDRRPRDFGEVVERLDGAAREGAGGVPSKGGGGGVVADVDGGSGPGEAGGPAPGGPGGGRKGRSVAAYAGLAGAALAVALFGVVNFFEWATSAEEPGARGAVETPADPVEGPGDLPDELVGPPEGVADAADPPERAGPAPDEPERAVDPSPDVGPGADAPDRRAPREKGPTDPVEAEAPAPEDADDAPVEPPEESPAPPGEGFGDRILVLVFGEGDSRWQVAEATILDRLLADGLPVVDETGVEMIRRGLDPAAPPPTGELPDLARAAEAGHLVVGQLESDASLSLRPSFYTGTADLVLRIYDPATGDLVHAHTVQVGRDGTAGELATSERSAREAAAEAVARSGAVHLSRSLRELIHPR